MELRRDAPPPRAWWKEVKQCLDSKLSLSIGCGTNHRARRIAQSLDRIRRSSGRGFIVSQRGTRVFVWFPPTGVP